jgi:hypothetical protein
VKRAQASETLRLLIIPFDAESVEQMPVMEIPRNLSLRDITFRIVNDKPVLGVFLTAFINNGAYYLTKIGVYADGMIDCWGLVDFEGFIRKAKSGWVVTMLPEGAEVGISDFTMFTANKMLYSVPESEFIKEVLDAIEELNARPSSMLLFVEAKKKYWNSPTEENQKLMHEAFEKVPHHKNKFVTNPRDRKYFKEQGIKSYDTVWELNKS